MFTKIGTFFEALTHLTNKGTELIEAEAKKKAGR
jgi:hypothetical protein